MIQQGNLVVQGIRPPHKTTKAGFPYHPVAWNKKSEGIGFARLTNRPWAGFQLSGHFAVGHGAGNGNDEQGIPDALLIHRTLWF